MSLHNLYAQRNNKTISGQSEYVVMDVDDILNVNTTSGSITIYLPNIANSGSLSRTIYINDVGGVAGTNPIILQGIGGNKVNGTTSVTLQENFGTAQCSIASLTEWLANLSTDAPSPTPGDKNFVYEQTVPSHTWSVVHNLNKRCAVQITDNNEVEIIGDIKWNNDNQVTITFNTPKTGFVYCN